MHGFDLLEYIVSNGLPCDLCIVRIQCSMGTHRNNRLHTQTTANASFSVWEFRFSISLKFLLAELITLLLPCCSWISTAPRPTGHASDLLLLEFGRLCQNIQGFLHLLTCSSAHWMLFSAHLQSWNTPFSLISYKNVQLLWQSLG